MNSLKVKRTGKPFSKSTPRAWLVDEHCMQGLFGEEVKRKKKASFFRTLYEKKYPQNAIDYEEVLFVRKPAAAPRLHVLGAPVKKQCADEY